MPAQFIMAALRKSPAYVGAHIASALALGHPHPKRDGLFREPGLEGGIVIAAKNMREKTFAQLWRRRKCCHAGIGHGGRAYMSRFDAARHIEPGGARGNPRVLS